MHEGAAWTSFGQPPRRSAAAWYWYWAWSRQPGRALGLGAADLEAAFDGALIKDVGSSARSAVGAPFYLDDQLVPALHMVAVDMDSPRSMLGWPVCPPTAPR